MIPNKSTNGRIEWVRRLAEVSPRWGAELGLLLFATPPPAKGPSFAERPDRFELCVNSQRVQGFAFGLSGPSVVLVHGWGGAAAQFRSFVAPLCQSGFRVFAFDAPGHGASAGRRSSIKAFAAALSALARRHGAPDAIVAHSLGCSATTLALCSGLPARRIVFLAPLVHPRAHFERFATHVGLDVNTACAIAERRFATRWWELELLRRARELQQPLLVLHDSDDRTTPLWEAESLVGAWPRAELRVTQGVGHRQMLSERSVVQQTLEFLRPLLPQESESPLREAPGRGAPMADCS